MADILLRNKFGSQVTYSDVSELEVDKVGGGTQKFQAGELTTKTVAADFGSGDQTVSASNGELITSVTVQAPDTLVPENVKDGVTIAGVTGTMTSSGSGDVKKNVDFYDCDGTLLYEYDVDEFLALTEMPPNPTREDLVAEGWNWSLADAKTAVQQGGFLSIGQNYHTPDGKNKIYLHVTEPHLSPKIQVYTNSYNNPPLVCIDWGDGSPIDTCEPSYQIYHRVQHTYASAGTYIISTWEERNIVASVSLQIMGENYSWSYERNIVKIYNSHPTAVLSGGATPKKLGQLEPSFYASFSNNTSGLYGVLSTPVAIIPAQYPLQSGRAINFTNSLCKIISLPNKTFNFFNYGNYSSMRLSSNLLKIFIPSNSILVAGIWNGCSKLVYVGLGNGCSSYGNSYENMFNDCTNLKELINFPFETALNNGLGLKNCSSFKFPPNFTPRPSVILESQFQNSAISSLDLSNCTTTYKTGLFSTYKLNNIRIPMSCNIALGTFGDYNSDSDWISEFEFLDANSNGALVSQGTYTTMGTFNSNQATLFLIPFKSLSAEWIYHRATGITSTKWNVYKTSTLGETLPMALDEISITNWYGNKTDAFNQQNPITTGTGGMVYGRVGAARTRVNRYTSSAGEVSSGTTLTQSVNATVGDLVIATFVVRSETHTLSNGWTEIGISNAAGSLNQRTGLAYKIADSTTESLTVTQDTAGRLYINMVAITGASLGTFSGFTTAATGNSITVTKPSGLVVWGVSSSYWGTSTPYQLWGVSNTDETIAIQLPKTTQPRCLTLLDQSDDSSMTFTYSPGQTGNGELAVGNVTITGIPDFWYYE